MIQKRTILKVSDNSGAKTARCIQVLGGFKKKNAKIGDIVVVSIQQLRNNIRNNSKIQKKEVYRALLIKTKKGFTKKNGFKSLFFENSIVLINKQGNPLGTRIVGSVSKALKKKTFQKFLSISSAII
jgi:large subunit ribosomal protein L14